MRWHLIYSCFNPSLRWWDLDVFGLIFIEFFQSVSPTHALKLEDDFLYKVGRTVARFARGGFAYRRTENQFAMLLPRVGKYERCDRAKQLNTEIRSLLKDYGLDDRYFPVIGVVSVPDDVQSVEQVREFGNSLLASAKGRVSRGVEFSTVVRLVHGGAGNGDQNS